MLELALMIFFAYLVVMGGVMLVYSWLWLRDRRGAASARHRRGQNSPGGTAVPGGRRRTVTRPDAGLHA